MGVKKPEQYDVLLLYDEEDCPDSSSEDSDSGDEQNQNSWRKIHAGKGVNNLKHILEKFVKLPLAGDNENGYRPPKVCRLHMDLVGKGPELQKLKEGIERSTYMFFYLSPSFSDADRAKTVNKLQKMKEDTLHETTNTENKRDSAIPIYVLSRRETTERNFSVPFGLRSIRGIDISTIMSDGTPIDEINIREIEEKDLDPFCLEKFTNLLSRRAYQLAERIRAETRQLSLEEEKDQVESIRRDKEMHEDLLETLEEKEHLTSELIDIQNRVIESTANVGIGSRNPAMMVNINIENAGTVQVGDNNVATVGQDSGDYDYEVEVIPIGKTATGRHVGVEVGDDEGLMNPNLSEEGQIVTTESGELSASPLLLNSTEDYEESPLGSFPDVNFPPAGGIRRDEMSLIQPSTRASQEDMPELDLTEEDQPSTQASQGRAANEEGFLSSLLNVTGPESFRGGSDPENYMNSQETEVLPGVGVNMRTLRLTTAALNDLIRRMSSRR